MNTNNSNQQFLHTIERTVIAEIIREGRNAFIEASSLVTEDDFRSPECAIIFRAMYCHHIEGDEINYVTLFRFITGQPHIIEDIFRKNLLFGDLREQAARVAGVMMDIVRESDAPANALQSGTLDRNCKIMKEEAMRRELIRIHAHAMRDLNDGASVFDAMDEAHKRIITMQAELEHLKGFVGLNDAMQCAIERAEQEERGEIVRVPTGFDGLDKITGGFENGTLTLLAAQTNIGKSLLAAQIALHVAKEKRLPAGIISLEMKSFEIARRYLAATAGVASIRDNRITAMKEACTEFKGVPLWMYDCSLTTKQLHTTLWRLVQERHARLIIIDYLQLLAVDKAQARWEEIGEVVKDLKNFAHDAGVPVLLISSLTTKQMAARINDVPLLSDVRDTSDAAYHADAVMFLYPPDADNDDYIELAVAKSRNTARGVIALQFDREHLVFRETARRGKPERSPKNKQEYQ